MPSLIHKSQSELDEQKRRTELYREMIRREAKIGGQLFGPVPQGVRREFFCLDRNTWIWHEEWVDPQNIRHSKTTRYDIRPDGIMKTQDGQSPRPVSPEEAQNLYQATKLYRQRVTTELYSR